VVERKRGKIIPLHPKKDEQNEERIAGMAKTGGKMNLELEPAKNSGPC
jgi:hypothetical protein